MYVHIRGSKFRALGVQYWLVIFFLDDVGGGGGGGGETKATLPGGGVHFRFLRLRPTAHSIPPNYYSAFGRAMHSGLLFNPRHGHQGAAFFFLFAPRAHTSKEESFCARNSFPRGRVIFGASFRYKFRSNYVLKIDWGSREGASNFNAFKTSCTCGLFKNLGLNLISEF